MREGHPLADPGALPLAAYCPADHLLVNFAGRPYGLADQALATLNRKRRIVLTVNQYFTAGRVVANSNQLTVLPAYFVEATGDRRPRAGRDTAAAVRPGRPACGDGLAPAQRPQQHAPVAARTPARSGRPAHRQRLTRRASSRMLAEVV